MINLDSQSIDDIFGGYRTCSLAALHCQALTKKVATAKSFVDPVHLPPTKTSINFHCLRVYYHSMICMNKATEIDSVNWDWKLNGDGLIPVMCDMDSTPDTLQKIIHCK